MVAKHDVVMKANSGNSQNNVIAAQNNLLKGSGTVNIGGTDAAATQSKLTNSKGQTGLFC